MNTRLLIQGRWIEGEWWGVVSDRLPLVLLHEGLGSVSLWRDFPAALAARTDRRVFAYSRFGHGQSDPPLTRRTPRFMHDEAALVPEVLEATGITRAVLFGHSDGGSIAIIAAAEHPRLVSSLVLEAAHVFVEDVSIASITRVERLYREANLRERLARHHRDVDSAFRGWSDVWLDPGFRSWNLEGYLPRVTCPTLLIQGDLDEYGTLAQITAIERQLTGASERLLLGDCGHSPHRDRPDLVLDTIDKFLAAQP